MCELEVLVTDIPYHMSQIHRRVKQGVTILDLRACAGDVGSLDEVVQGQGFYDFHFPGTQGFPKCECRFAASHPHAEFAITLPTSLPQPCPL